MGKHDTGHGRRHTPTPVKVTRRPTRKPPPTVVPPAPAAPTPPSELATAARRVLAATAQLFGHPDYETHIPGCPSGGGGPCTCGYTELVDALGALRAALPPS